MEATAESARRAGRPGADTRVLPDEATVLKRGLEAFAELGYDRASARELARRLGVSHNFINDRYGSKAAFWRAVVDSVLGVQLARVSMEDPAIEDPAVDDAERLRRIITGIYLGSADAPQFGRLIVDELSQDTERLDYLYEQYLEPVLRTLASSTDRLVAAGRMAPVPMNVLFFAIFPPISGMVEIPLARRLGRPDPATPEQLAATAESLATLVINGLLATASGSPR